MNIDVLAEFSLPMLTTKPEFSAFDYSAAQYEPEPGRASSYDQKAVLREHHMTVYDPAITYHVQYSYKE